MKNPERRIRRISNFSYYLCVSSKYTENLYEECHSIRKISRNLNNLYSDRSEPNLKIPASKLRYDEINLQNDDYAIETRKHIANIVQLNDMPPDTLET